MRSSLHPSITAVILGAISIAWLAGPAAGQANEFRLGQSSGRLSAEFTRVVGVRALADGRVLILDGGDNRMLIADFGRDSVATVGGQGAGPGEYRRPFALAAIGRDSTVIIDPGNRRWLVHAAGGVLQTLPPDYPATVATRGAARTGDGNGRLMVVGPPTITEKTDRIGKGDSVVVTLVTIRSAAADTVARLLASPVSMPKQFDAAGKVTRVDFITPPWAVGEEAMLFPDGWLGVARLEPYRVDWRTPAGEWVRGAPLPIAEVKAGPRERDAFLAAQQERTGRPAPQPPADAWPAAVPPFQPGPLVPAPDGTLLIRRTPTADHPGDRYDRVDRQGRLVGWLELPAGDRLIAAADGQAYVVRTDDDGIQRLLRYRW
ncbi:MAG: hypothetical protein AB7L66_01065 [Gemmatimonadales bacterium]